MEAVDVRGRFVWHQLLTRDVPGAKKFYPSLTGWKAQPWPADPTYTVCHAGDVPTAGMMAMAPEFPAEVPPHPLPERLQVALVVRPIHQVVDRLQALVAGQIVLLAHG